MLVLIKMTHCSMHTILNQYQESSRAFKFCPRATCGPRPVVGPYSSKYSLFLIWWFVVGAI